MNFKPKYQIMDLKNNIVATIDGETVLTPAGYKVVPIKPTMIKRWLWAIKREHGDTCWDIRWFMETEKSIAAIFPKENYQKLLWSETEFEE